MSRTPVASRSHPDWLLSPWRRRTSGRGGEGAGGGAVLVKPRDAWHKKLFVGSLGVEIISEAGRIESVAV